MKIKYDEHAAPTTGEEAESPEKSVAVASVDDAPEETGSAADDEPMSAEVLDDVEEDAHEEGAEYQLYDPNHTFEKDLTDYQNI